MVRALPPSPSDEGPGPRQNPIVFRRFSAAAVQPGSRRNASRKWKTASVLLLFSFGLPLMPVDRHVDRVAHRVGLVGPKVSADDSHDLFLGMLEPDEMYEAHVNLIQHGRKICHAQRPECGRCPIRARCRYVDPKAP